MPKKGNIPWNKGLKGHPSCKGFTGKHSNKTKKQISENRKGKNIGNTQGFKKGQKPWNKGNPYFIHDKEWRQKVSKAVSGSNHWNWKGGITIPNRMYRNSTRHKEWSNAVKQRDHWTCQSCGYKGNKIIAHHIVEFSKDKSLRFDVSNGVTLCRPCHMILHSPRRHYNSKCAN
jgi:hypothetical protein